MPEFDLGTALSARKGAGKAGRLPAPAARVQGHAHGWVTGEADTRPSLRGWF